MRNVAVRLCNREILCSDLFSPDTDTCTHWPAVFPHILVI